jgi:uncharacterized protein YbaR (Trm112 family)
MTEKIASLVKILQCPICKRDSGNRLVLLPHKEQRLDPLFCKECGTDFTVIVDDNGVICGRLSHAMAD